jgi:hypothetical protein
MKTCLPITNSFMQILAISSAFAQTGDDAATSGAGLFWIIVVLAGEGHPHIFGLSAGDGSLSVIQFSGAKPCFFSNFKISQSLKRGIHTWILRQIQGNTSKPN